MMRQDENYMLGVKGKIYLSPNEIGYIVANADHVQQAHFFEALARNMDYYNYSNQNYEVAKLIKEKGFETRNKVIDVLGSLVEHLSTSC